jgi:hypothetical protein
MMDKGLKRRRKEEDDDGRGIKTRQSLEARSGRWWG